MDFGSPPSARGVRGRAVVRHLGNGDLAGGIGEDVRRGLSAQPKFVPPKYFYDEHGSRLFEQICRTPEYYLTRTEEQLLEQFADELVGNVRPQAIIELGSGSSHKTEHLLRACDRQRCHARYLPFDVSTEMLHHAGERLLEHYPWLRVEALIGDYCHDLSRIPETPGPRLFLFLGSTIGNFDDAEAQAFLRSLGALMAPEDRLLIGLDRVKDADVLNAAYNDAAGVTAQFNLNVLNVINRLLAAEFRPETFEHRAAYHPGRERVEMYLHSRVAQTVPIQALHMGASFYSGEPILTEISRKFTPGSFSALLAAGGFAPQRHYEPADGYFSLVLAQARPETG